jgi:hypothetical protein
MKMNYLKLGFAIALTSIVVTGCDDAKTEEAKPNNTTTEEPFMASTAASMRVALLEDFTGVRCGFCPDGHVRAVAAQQEFRELALQLGSMGGQAFLECGDQLRVEGLLMDACDER